MNTKLLRKVRDAILAEPLKFDMDDWFHKDDQSPCGTTACIAGHAVVMSKHYKSLRPGLRMSDRSVIRLAMMALDVSDDTAWNLFGLSFWPLRYFEMYRRAKTQAGRARAAALRIDRFIKTNGKD